MVEFYPQFIDSDEAFGGERLQLHYIPLEHAIFWDENPKKHAISDIVRSIQDNGFGSPPKWDTNLNGSKGGLVFGNGRTHALRWMKHKGMAPPRGILINEDTGQWAVPVLFGLDARSLGAAERFALDHNNLVMAGGDFSSGDMMRHLYDPDSYIRILDKLEFDQNLPITVEQEDVKSLKASLAGVFSGDDDMVTQKTDVSGEKATKASSLSSNDGHHDMSDNWPQIKARVRPDLYDLFLEYTEDFGETDDERLEGWLLQYKKVKNAYSD